MSMLAVFGLLRHISNSVGSKNHSYFSKSQFVIKLYELGLKNHI